MATVEGLDKVLARFEAIPEAVRQASREALERGADEIVAMMRRLAPRRTGLVAESIGWTWGEAPAGSITVGTVGGRDYGTQRITIYAGGGAAYYARFLEFGTKDMRAHPFFFPAYRALRTRVRSRVARKVRDAARKSFGG